MLVMNVTTSLSQILARKCKPKVAVGHKLTAQKMESWGVTFPITINEATMNSKNITNENNI